MHPGAQLAEPLENLVDGMGLESSWTSSGFFKPISCIAPLTGDKCLPFIGRSAQSNRCQTRAEGRWPEESRVAAGLAANAVTMELVTMLQSRGVAADAFAVMTGAIESLRRMAQEQPHPVWDAA